jgi:outer membrane protein assembly factor BamE
VLEFMKIFYAVPLATTLLALALSGCGTTEGVNNAMRSGIEMLRPYRVEVIQGNFVSKEQVAALKAGMTRDDVRNILGTPLVQSAFHEARWDYAFTIRRQGIESQARKLTLLFKADKLDKWEGDEMPSELEFVKTLTPTRSFGKEPELKASEDKLKDFAARNASNASAGSAQAAASGPIRTSYPPLEASR